MTDFDYSNNGMEKKALDSVSTNTKMKKRLKDAVSSLRHPYSAMFKKEKLDFVRKCMISDGDDYELCWRVREKPHKPVSYRNQQTSIGFVELKRR